MALALYRKYRPRTFAEVIGQEHVTEPLSQALRSGRLHHAYLFSGPRGCGKTSSARILARSLNCEQGPTPEPCGVCASCRSLANDGAGSIDVIEIDAASHGGVDDARELREKAFFAPASSRYKIYVIDEAHMVSSAGFNALLKLVEEPPDYVKFIFATTEPEKVLGTIRSRTHHYPFRLIPPAVLRPYLQQLTEAEGIHVEPAVFPLVVRAGGGSARDTLSVLDQLIAGAGPDGVSYPRAVALLGVTDVTLIDEMCDALAAGDGAAAYSTIDRVAEAGHDPRRFASDLLERFRDLIVLQQVPDAVAKGLIDGPADQLEAMSAQATRLGPATLSRCADIVHNGLVEMRGTTAPRLLLELITARMLLPGAEDSTGALLQRLERMERRLTLAGDPPAVRGEAEPAQPVTGSAPVPPVTGSSQQASSGSAGGGLSAARAAAAAAAAGRRSAPGRPGSSSPGAAEAPAPGGESGAAVREGAPAGQAPGAAAPDGPLTDGPAQQPGLAQSPGSGGSSDAGSPAGSGRSDSGAHMAPSGGASTAPAGGAPTTPAGGAPMGPSGHDDEPPWDDEPEPYPADDWDGGEPGPARGRAADPRAQGLPTQSRSGGSGQDPSSDSSAQRRSPNSSGAASGFAERSAGPDGPAVAAGRSAGTGAAGGGARAERRGEPAGVLPDAPEEPGVAAVTGAPGQLTAAAVREVWPEIVAAIGRKSKKVSALAAGATVRDLDGQTVILTFRYPAHAKMVAPEAPLIASALYEALGGQWQVRCEVAGEAGGAALGPPAPAAPRRPEPGREPAGGRPAQAVGAQQAQAVGAQQAQAASARAPQSRRQETEASSSGGDDDWPEPARPGGLSGAAAPAEADEDWPEVRPIGAAEARDGRGSPPGGDAPGGARQAGGTGASPADTRHGAGSGAEQGGGSAGSEPGNGVGGLSGRGTPAAAVRGPGEAGGGADPAMVNPRAGLAGSHPTGAAGDGGWDSDPPTRDSRGGSALGGPPGASGGVAGRAVNGGASGGAAGANAGGAAGGNAGGAAGGNAGGAAGGNAGGAAGGNGGGAAGGGASGWGVNGAVGGGVTGSHVGGVVGGSAAGVVGGGAAGTGSGTSAGSGAAGPAGAAAGDPPRTGRNAAPGSGLAAARAAAAGARNAAAARQAAKPAAPASWSDGSPAEEAPYDPEYDGPPPGGVASFEGFDPGDEPTDDVIDEKTARESSEQQAMRLLREAFGAEKIGES